MFEVGDYIGYVAAILTTVSFVPQAYKTIKTKDTSGISLWMYLLFTVGILLWFTYGVSLNNPAIYLSNGVTAVFSSIILITKIASVVKEKRHAR
ncbi:MAG: SemiSWEET transporter [Bacillota bacterium]|nr:SemiSWEET transporter [Bacillota bacterium]